MNSIRRILHATDFSPASRRAFDTAVALTTALRARLILVTVVPPVFTVPSQYMDAVTYDQLTLQTLKSSGRLIERLRARATKLTGQKTAAVLREGEPADEIVRASRATKADIIVMGTHGRHGLPKLLLGSVAQRVLSRAKCPVLTVRGPGGRPR